MNLQPALLEVPADAPTHRRRLHIFKRENGIETHNCKGEWLAAHMPSCRKFGYGVTDQSSLFDCFCKVGRLIEEAGYAVYGKSEREAVHNLCDNIQQPFTP